MTAWTEHLARAGRHASTKPPAPSPSPRPPTKRARPRPPPSRCRCCTWARSARRARTPPPSCTTWCRTTSSTWKPTPRRGTASIRPRADDRQLLVWTEEGGHALALSADILPAFLKKFSMYVLRSKVKLADASAEVALIGLAGPQAVAIAQAAGAAPPPRTCARRYRPRACAASASARSAWCSPSPPTPPGAVRRARRRRRCVPAPRPTLGMIRAGLALVTTPTQEEFVAQMLNYELIGGWTSTRAAIRARDRRAHPVPRQLKKRTYRLALPADSTAAPGTDVYAPDWRAVRRQAGQRRTDRRRWRRGACGDPVEQRGSRRDPCRRARQASAQTRSTCRMRCARLTGTATARGPGRTRRGA